MPKVKNINGTSANKCNCSSWLEHWKKFSKTSVTFCSEKGCINKELVGAHVQKTTSDMSWYIIPLCQSHNKTGGEIEVTETTVFVPANVKETCGK